MLVQTKTSQDFWFPIEVAGAALVETGMCTQNGFSSPLASERTTAKHPRATGVGGPMSDTWTLQ